MNRIGEEIHKLVDPDFGIEEVIEMVISTGELANTQKEKIKLIQEFTKNFNNEYMIIRKDNWDANWENRKNTITNGSWKKI